MLEAWNLLNPMNLFMHARTIVQGHTHLNSASSVDTKRPQLPTMYGTTVANVYTHKELYYCSFVTQAMTQRVQMCLTEQSLCV